MIQEIGDRNWEKFGCLEEDLGGEAMHLLFFLPQSSRLTFQTEKVP